MKARRWEAWKPGLLIAVLALSLNLGFFLRNAALFPSPLGDQSALLRNETYAPAALACNAARTSTLELGAPVGLRVGDGGETWNVALQRHVAGLCALLRVDPNDPRITYQSQTFHVVPFSTEEGEAGNPVQLLLILLVVAGCLALPRIRGDRFVLLYIAALLGGAVAFIAYLKWQPFGTRLMLPAHILAAPLCGVLLGRIHGGKVASLVLSGALVVASLPFLLDNSTRPLFHGPITSVLRANRFDQYFAAQPGLEEPFVGASRLIASQRCPNVGLLGGDDTWEYPLWVALRSATPDVRIEHVLVNNVSTPLYQREPFSSFRPCAIVGIVDDSADPPSVSGLILPTPYGPFRRAWVQDGSQGQIVAVYLRR